MEYLRKNLGASFRTSPFQAPWQAWAPVPVYIFIALAIGFGTGLLKFEWQQAQIAPLLPITLFVFPSLLEEAFFRGILIPRDILQSGIPKAALAVVGSTILYVAWHPLNAFAVHHAAAGLFWDPWFLMIVFALGLTCGYAYVVSGSIWVPILIHWATVLVWVFFLGGTNLILEW